MARPTIQVRVAFENGLYDSVTSLNWTDITEFVREEPIAIRRGRSDERSPFESGTLTLTLDNRDRRFEAENDSGPYWPNVLPGRWVNVRAQYDGIWRDLYTGYVTSWQQQYREGRDATVTLEAADAFRLFNLERRTDSLVGSVSDYGILLLLCLRIGWPSQNRVFDFNDLTPVGDWSLSNGNVLEAMRSVVDGTLGALFVDVDGRLRWQSRFHRVRNNTPLALFGDGTTLQQSLQWLVGQSFLSQGTVLRAGSSWPTELPYRDVTFDYGERLVANHVQVSRDGGAVQEVERAASITKYRRRTLQRLNLRLRDDNDALAQAQWLLQQYATPIVRPSSVTVSPLASDALWTPVLTLNLSDRVTVIKRPPAGGGTIVKDARIEGIEHRFTKYGDWVTTYRLSPAPSDNYWLLGTAALDTNGAMLAY